MSYLFVPFPMGELGFHQFIQDAKTQHLIQTQGMKPRPTRAAFDFICAGALWALFPSLIAKIFFSMTWTNFSIVVGSLSMLNIMTMPFPQHHSLTLFKITKFTNLAVSLGVITTHLICTFYTFPSLINIASLLIMIITPAFNYHGSKFLKKKLSKLSLQNQKLAYQHLWGNYCIKLPSHVISLFLKKALISNAASIAWVVMHILTPPSTPLAETFRAVLLIRTILMLEYI